MPNYTGIQKEVFEEYKRIRKSNGIDEENEVIHQHVSSEAFANLRRKYLEKIYKHRKRNVISYYSAFLQKQDNVANSNPALTINDEDKNGFMNAIYKMDTNKGLDIILHTPGGDIAATESLIHYLYEKFGNNITAIIPQIAMSGGTLIACACKEIFMSKHSNIGPIDPQIFGIPAGAILEEFEFILKSAETRPGTIPILQKLVEKYHPGFLVQCKNALDLSSTIAREFLERNMLKGKSKECIDNVINSLNEHSQTKTHARHIHANKAKDMGLNIKDIEEDSVLQELILSTHHLYMQTFQRTPLIKNIENHFGNHMSISN